MNFPSLPAHLGAALLWFQIMAAVHADSPPAIEWQRSFGGTNEDDCDWVVPVDDGGFLLGGSSRSAVAPNKSAPGYGLSDFWLVKLDATGRRIWDRAFGGSADEFISGMAPAADGGVVMAGMSVSGVSGNKTTARIGGDDFWVVRASRDGVKLWDKTYGGTGDDILTTVVPAGNGDFLLAGLSRSAPSGNKTSPTNGDHDMWVVRIGGDGNQIWDQSFGGSLREGDDIWSPFSIVPAGDGGFYLGGPSLSGVSGNKTAPGRGGWDYWLVRIDGDGNKLWDASYGGSGDDIPVAMSLTGDGHLLLAGESRSGISGNKTTPSYGLRDAWLVKVDSHGTKLWDRTIGAAGEDSFMSIAPATGGGFFLGGYRGCYSLCGDTDYWLVNVDAAGNKLWEQSFGGTGYDNFETISPSNDGGLLLAGGSLSGISRNKTAPAYGGKDVWVVKVGWARPPLRIAASGNDVRVSWPAGTADWILESSRSLAHGWTTVPPPYPSDTTGLFFTAPATAGSQFFRLRKQ